MTGSGQSDTSRSKFVVEADNRLVIAWDPLAAVLDVDLGVPEGTIAEEPGYEITLNSAEATALRDWLAKVMPE